MGRDTTYDLYKKKKSQSLRQARHYLEYVVIIFLIRFTGLFSIVLNQKFGGLLGRLAFRLASKDRKIAEYQVDFCFPDATKAVKDRIVAASFVNLGKTLTETLVLHKFRKQGLKRIHLVEEAAVQRAIDAGKGAIIVFGHLGNWELIGIVCEILGVNGSIVSSTVGNNRLDQILLKNRYSENIEVIQQGSKMAAISINKCFRNNSCLLLAFDQDLKVESIFVDFFGRKAYTTKNVAYLAGRYDVPVIAAFGTRLENGNHQFSFELLSEGPYEKGEENIVNLTQSYSLAFESHIRQHPEQWAWIHRRWKTQPD